MAAPCSLLLVDDDLELLQIFARRFTRRGYRVTAVGHPRLAEQAVQQGEFHVAVLDRTLPERDGIELMCRLRELDADLQVILLTGRDDPDSADRAVALGAFAYLSKPCRLSDLEEAAEKAAQFREFSRRTPADRAARPSERELPRPSSQG